MVVEIKLSYAFNLQCASGKPKLKTAIEYHLNTNSVGIDAQSLPDGDTSLVSKSDSVGCIG